MKIHMYIYFRLDLCVRTQQMSGNLCYAEKGEILNRYTHERIYLWTGGAVER